MREIEDPERGLTAAPTRADEAGFSAATARRAMRVWILLLLTAALNGLDLLMTLSAMQTGNFREMNPVGRLMMADPGLLIVSKIGVGSMSLFILAMFRRKRVTEVACWGVTLAYSMLAFMWLIYSISR
ncbi:MAG: DUF5658 family protein [Phycisphaerae bacterium]